MRDQLTRSSLSDDFDPPTLRAAVTASSVSRAQAMRDAVAADGASTGSSLRKSDFALCYPPLSFVNDTSARRILQGQNGRTKDVATYLIILASA